MSVAFFFYLASIQKFIKKDKKEFKNVPDPGQLLI